MASAETGTPSGGSQGGPAAERLEENPTRPAGADAKILSLAELAAAAHRLRESGLRVVQAHGSFDLLHVGHLRHLRAAKAFGDVLVVTITADRFVSKGPGRPVFAERLRAEMLAALEIVAHVAIVEAADALPAIAAIRPAVYAKGEEYRNPADDVTGMIVHERAAVERFGGALCFTDGATFSSTQLINRHLSALDPPVRRYLSALRERDALATILNAIDALADKAVTFVGDAIIDEYRYVLPMGKPPKEHIIAARRQSEEVFAGGVIAAANHAAGLCRHIDVVTGLGEEESHEALVRRSLKPNVDLRAVVRPQAPTTLKRRYVDAGSLRKLFEVYHIDDAPLAPALASELDRLVDTYCPRADAVVVTDFGHGLIGPQTIDRLVASAPFLAVNAQTNSANLGYNLVTRYPGPDFVCIDEHEARLAVADRASSPEDVVRHLADRMAACPNIVVTTGSRGCLAYSRAGDRVQAIPAVAQHPTDTMGAGDAFLAVAAPLVALGLPLELAGFVGNVAGTLKVGVVGHRSAIGKAALVKAITGLLK
ncbi:MAG: adenylyltransferase/cytidyltransferase family protein [Rhodospirillaceae bacterium]|nr:adenylyltransferase/cytidyltransferase family protein [Rhodospirillaceae bacterium]